MRKPSGDRLEWKLNKLYYENEFKVEIIQDSVYPTLFRLKWPDGEISHDFYNKTRARQNARRIAMGDLKWNTEERHKGGTAAALKVLSPSEIAQMKKNPNYWLFPEEGFPQTIYWKVVAGNRRLSVLEDHDLVFDKYDLQIRKLI